MQPHSTLTGPWLIALGLSGLLACGCSEQAEAPSPNRTGLGGTAGSAGVGGVGGVAGAGGVGGGTGGSGGTAGSSGMAGESGTAGSGGDAGNAGTAGTGGSGAEGGTAGSGGDAGSGGSGGSGGGTANCPDIGLDPNATSYFVCDCQSGAAAECQAGDDAGAGTREDPWRTYERARVTFETLQAGDTIAFCRGGAFEVDAGSGSAWVNAACKADKPCVVRDYTPEGVPSNAERPQLTFKDRGGFAFLDAADADHEEGYTLLNLKLKGNNVEEGFFAANDIDDLLICNMEIDSFDIGVHVAGSNPPAPGSDGLNERIILRSSVVKNCPNQGWLGGGNGSGVEYSTFQNNGSATAIFNHNIYFSGSSGQADRGLHAVGNTLYQSALIGGKCTAVSLVVHNEHDDLLIEGNTVREDVGAAEGGCWGIAVDEGGKEAFHNAIIRNNVVINVGNVAIGLNGCVDCLIENNVVISEQTDYSTTGIAAPDSTSTFMMERLTVRNNTILFAGGSPELGILVEGAGTGHVIVSNAIYSTKAAAFPCFSFGLLASAYAAIDSNLCFAPGGADARWERNAGSLLEWQALGSFDANSQWADPLFKNSVGPDADVTPGSNSPLIGKGDPTRSALVDKNGKVRGSTPSIGALEP